MHVIAYPSFATAATVSVTSGTQSKSLPQETLLIALPDAMVYENERVRVVKPSGTIANVRPFWF